MEIRLHNMIMHTRVLGPGVRTAVWLQGCLRTCENCMSPASRPVDGGRMVDADDVIEAIISTSDIEGVTISGGEPFLQPLVLHYVLKSIREQSDLGIIIYTGYTIRELKDLCIPQIDDIITCMADLIIDGEYVDELNDGRALIGSRNQSLNFITDRYRSFEYIYNSKERNTEIIATEKEVFLMGIPSKDNYLKWLKMTAELKKM